MDTMLKQKHTQMVSAHIRGLVACKQLTKEQGENRLDYFTRKQRRSVELFNSPFVFLVADTLGMFNDVYYSHMRADIAPAEARSSIEGVKAWAVDKCALLGYPVEWLAPLDNVKGLTFVSVNRALRQCQLELETVHFNSQLVSITAEEGKEEKPKRVKVVLADGVSETEYNRELARKQLLGRETNRKKLLEQIKQADREKALQQKIKDNSFKGLVWRFNNWLNGDEK